MYNLSVPASRVLLLKYRNSKFRIKTAISPLATSSYGGTFAPFYNTLLDTLPGSGEVC